MDEIRFPAFGQGTTDAMLQKRQKKSPVLGIRITP
jgi:hypothetical protein